MLIQITSATTGKKETEPERQRLAKQILTEIDDCMIKENSKFRSWKLGASEIGHKCERYLWYKFRWFFTEKFNGRKLRLFDRGHREEIRFEEWLQATGWRVECSGRQQLKLIGVEGHFKAKPDAIISRDGLTMIASFKTKGTGKGFEELLYNGVITQPSHVSQMCAEYALLNQTYPATGITLGAYFNTNKNDDDMYVEVIELDLAHGQTMVERARRIISSPIPLTKISEKPTWYECAGCAAKDVCHFGTEPNHNCRTCAASVPIAEGQWHCKMFNQQIPEEITKTGCEAWTKIQ